MRPSWNLPLMKSRLNDVLVPSLLVAAILVVSLNALFAFRSIDVLLHGEEWVQHTWMVINQVEEIMSLAKDAETGNRGFLLTGSDEYLEPYQAALRQLPLELQRFRTLIKDNADQQTRLTEMQAVLEERLSLLQQGIDLRRTGDRESVHALVLGGTGKQEMDHLRRIAESMESEERRLLTFRVAETAISSRRTRNTIGLASLFDLLLIVLILRYVQRERALRLATEETAARLAASRREVEAKALELQALNATLEERVHLRTAELETTNRELEAFSYSVSHDLRAPLRTIDGFSLALEEDYAEAVDGVGRDYIRRVRTGVQRMGELIDALLQLSRITRAAIERETFDLSALADAIASDLRDQNPGKEIAFHIQQGLKANADPHLLRVALENLMGNAVKFSTKVPHPFVEFGWDTEKSAWFIRDNGAGFDMYYAEKLFNAFNRLHGDKDFKGSGIGLATVARVIRRHHGTIWADSVVDRGATFWFTLG